MRVDIDRIIYFTEGVDSLPALAEFLTEKGVDTSERTLYRWKKGGPIGKPKLMATAEALGMGLSDIVILDEPSEGRPRTVSIVMWEALKASHDSLLAENKRLKKEPAAEWARCSEISDEDIDLLPDGIADDKQKASLKQRKDELSHNVLEYLMENHFTDAFRSVAQDMLDNDIFESMMEEVEEC